VVEELGPDVSTGLFTALTMEEGRGGAEEVTDRRAEGGREGGREEGGGE